jgi:hypothetical protein
MQNPDRDITAEVGALEADIRHHVIDLEVAFSTRDWALVARIYRNVAALADRLEALDPDARSRTLERIELEQEAREEAYSEDDDPLLEELELEPRDSHDGRDPFSPWRLR